MINSVTKGTCTQEILVALILGPIILNKLLAFIRERIATVKLMVLSQPYTALPLEDNEVGSKI